MSDNRLSHWNDGQTRTAILAFIDAATTEGGPDWIAPNDRIAVFDNDGTLWAEQPMYVQAAFAFDRIRQLAPEHPEWNDSPVLSAAIQGDIGAALSGGMKALVELVYASHAGITADAFTEVVAQWLASAAHPTLDRPYTELVFKPMVELLHLLRDSGFATFIVSGGGVEFIRVFAEATYGVPPYDVVGSTIKTRFEYADGRAELLRDAEIDFIDDGDGKPVGIGKFIGRRPAICVGNSDGDLAMMRYTAARSGPFLNVLLHHDDAEREFAYDKDSAFGKLDAALTEAQDRGWTVVSMKNDFATVFD